MSKKRTFAVRVLAWLLVLCMVLPLAQIDQAAYATEEAPNNREEVISGENPGGENPGGENPGGENPGVENPGGENPGGENPGGENPDGEPSDVDEITQDEPSLTALLPDEEISTSVTVTETTSLSRPYVWGDGTATDQNQHPGHLVLSVQAGNGATISGFAWNDDTQRYEYPLTADDLLALGVLTQEERNNLAQPEGDYGTIVIADKGDNSLTRSSLEVIGLPSKVVVTTTTTAVDGTVASTTQEKPIYWNSVSIDRVQLPEEGFNLAGVDIVKYEIEDQNPGDPNSQLFLRPYREICFSLQTRFGTDDPAAVLRELLAEQDDNYIVATLSHSSTGFSARPMEILTKADLETLGYTLPAALIRTVPVYDDAKYEITYYLDSVVDLELVDGQRTMKCEVYHDNSGVPGFGDRTDLTFSGGALILGRSGITPYQFTKVWLDDPVTDPASRPQTTYTLWRYANDDKANYQEASQIKIDGVSTWPMPTGAATEETEAANSITTAFENLPRFDSDGNEYIYFIREAAPGAGYEQVFGEVSQNPDGSFTVTDTLPYDSERQPADTSVYDMGTISNRRTSTVAITATKDWVAACFQNKLAEVSVQFALYARPKDEPDASWSEVQELVMNNFSAIHPSDGLDLSMPKYDAMGQELEYALVEKSITQGGITVTNPNLGEGFDPTQAANFDYQLPMNKEHLQEESLFHLDGDAADAAFIVPQDEYEEKDYFKSESNKEEIDGVTTYHFTNSLEGSTDYFLQKVWAAGMTPEDVTITVIQLDKSGNPTGEKWPVTIKAVECEKQEDGTFKSSWVSLNQRLNVELLRYDETGAEYTYIVEEDWGRAVYDNGYDIDNDGKGEANATQVVNGNGTQTIDVRKQWLDDNAYDERQPVYFNVYLKDGALVYGSEGETTGIISDKPVMLSAAVNWWRRIDAEVYFDTAEDGTVTYYNRTQERPDTAQPYEDTFIVTEVQMGDTVIDPANRNDADFTTYCSSNNVQYAVVYSGAYEGAVNTTLNGKAVNNMGTAGPDAQNFYTVTNLRTGTYEATVTKVWQDDGYTFEGLQRPDASISIKALDQDENFIQDDADGKASYVSVPMVIDQDGKQYIKTKAEDDKLVNTTATQTLTTGGSTANENQETLYFLNLPLYDSYGKLIDYTLEETMLDEDTDYLSSKGILTETREDGVINATLTFTNTPVNTKDVVFHMLWLDQYNYERDLRPDVYLYLYKTVYDEDGNPSIVRHDFVEYQWKAKSGDTTNSWTYEFKNLPKYDEKGHEITYYAELRSHVDVKVLDYLDIQYGQGELTTWEAYDGVKDINKVKVVGDEYVVSTTPEVSGNEDVIGQVKDSERIVMKEDNTFVAQLQNEMVVQGQKVWEKIPVGYPISQTPKLTFKLYNNDQVVMDEKGNLILDENGVPILKDGAEAVAYINEYQSLSVNYSFQMKWEGENTADGQPIASDSGPLPLYDSLGNRIYYTVIETMTDNSNGIQVAYENLSGAINGYRVTNTFVDHTKNTRELEISKLWRESISGGEATEVTDKSKLPDSITFDLFRFYQKLDEYGNLIGYSIAQKVETVTLTKANDFKPVSFGEQLIYDPSGHPFYYYLYERKVDGYECEITLSDVQIVPEEAGMPSVLGQPFYSQAFTLLDEKGNEVQDSAKATAGATNTYTGTPHFSVSGTKQWLDYSNAFQIRPESLTLTITRRAEGIGEQAFATVTLEPDDEQKEVILAIGVTNYAGDVKLTTTAADDNIWTFTIGPLDGTAPNGKRWVYTFTETLENGAEKIYTADIKSGTAAAPGNGNGGGTVNLSPALKNSNLTDVKVVKKWQDAAGKDLANIQMPSITLRLQVSEDGNHWNWADEYFTKKPVQGLNTSALTVTLNSGTESHTFRNLPKSFKDGEEYKNFQYRVMETKIGEVEIAFEDPDGVDYANPANSAWTITSEVNGNTTVTNRSKVTQIEITKTWADDSDNAYGTRGDVDGNAATTWSVLYRIYRYTDVNGTKTWERVTQRNGSELLLTISGGNDDGSGTAGLDQLPAADPSGNPYTYVAVELNPDGSPVDDRYNGAYDASAGGNANGTYDGAKYGTAFSNTLQTTSLAVTKNWAEDVSSMRPESISLQLRQNGKGITPHIQPVWTKADENNTWSIEFIGLPRFDTAGQPYVYDVVEKDAPLSGYYKPIYSGVTDENGDEITEDSTNQQQAITNTATKLQINKTGKDGEPLNGVTLVYRSDSQINNSFWWLVWNRDESGGESYTIYRSQADSYANVLPGEKWTEGSVPAGTAVTITGLPVGTYTLVAEPSLPLGYYGSAVGSHTFTIAPNVPAQEDAVQLETATNSQTHLSLRKTDDKGNPIAAGWVFSITGRFADAPENLNAVKNLTHENSSLTGLLIVGETYTLKEVTAPTGYVLYTGEVKFHVADDTSGTIVIDSQNSHARVENTNTIVFKNDPYEIPILKTDRSGNPLTGAVFAVYSAEYTPANPGDPLALSEESNGRLVIKCAGKLAVGNTYTLVEAKAPDGYILPNAAYARFTVDINGVVTSVDSCGLNASVQPGDDGTLCIQVADDPIDITIKKVDGLYDGSGTDIMSGISFTLTPAGGGTPQTATTDENGKLYFGPTANANTFAVVGGTTYILSETTTGYHPFEATVTVNLDGTLSVSAVSEKSTITLDRGSSTSATVTTLRQKGSVSIIKYGCKPDGSDPQPLAAATFKLSWSKDGHSKEWVEKTGSDGIAQWTGLEWGEYTLEEVSAPPGYIKYEGTITVTIGPDSLVWSFTSTANLKLTNYMNQLSIFKQDQDGKPLQATLELEQLDGSYKASTTEGQLLLTGLPAGRYKLTETVAPKGCRLPAADSATLYFTMGEDGKITPTDKDGNTIDNTGLFTVTNGTKGDGGVYPNAITMVNDLIPAALEKADEDGKKLSGAVFTVKPKTETDAFAGGMDSIVITDTTPDALNGQLIGGNSYTVTEDQAPEGYRKPGTSFTLTVDVYGNLSITIDDPARANGATVEIDAANKALIRVKDQLTSFSFTKLGQTSEDCADDPAATAPLQGVTFTAYRDAACTDKLAEAVSDARGTVTFRGLPLGTCYVKETAAPANHILDDTVYTVVISSDQQAVLTLDGQPVANNTLINRRYRADLSFTKQGELDGAPVPGGVYGLYRDGVLVARCTSDAKGAVLFEGLLTGVDYTLRELSVPDGYYRSTGEVKFRFVVEDGQPVFRLLDNGGGVFEGKDEAYTWAEPQIRLSILKTDYAGRPLSGALLQLKDSRGNIVPVIDEDGNSAETWLSTKEPMVFSSQLKAGETYTLIELRAPDGYYLARNIVFTLDETAACGEGKTVKITMRDFPMPANLIRTGDSSRIGLYMATAAASGLLALGLVYVLLRRKKKRQNGQ